MKLIHLTERIWLFPFEEYRDRPFLGYIQGDKWSLAVDAGHSAEHTASFYKAIEDERLQLPSLTVLTHWHWDHTLGMHAVHGLCLSNTRTNEHIHAFRDRLLQEGREAFLSLDEKIRNEYAHNKPIFVTLPDILYRNEIILDTGNCPVRILQTDSPHTDDSSLIYVPGEKVLFLGDAAYGMFPTWESDPILCENLIKTISSLDADICIESHHDTLSKSEAIAGLKASC